MSNNIGGFAAFMIALVVIGGAEKITKTICNRPVRPRKTPLQERLWKELAHQVELARAENAEITPEQLKEKVTAAVSGIYELAILDCVDLDEIDNLKRLYDLKTTFLATGSIPTA